LRKYRGANYNRYNRIKGIRIPAYLKKKWGGIARFRLENEMREHVLIRGIIKGR